MPLIHLILLEPIEPKVLSYHNKTPEHSYSFIEKHVCQSPIDIVLQNLIECMAFTDDLKPLLLSHTLPIVCLLNARQDC